jgi:hypothetical protein
MASAAYTAPVSKKMLWAGWIISAVPAAMLLLSCALKLMRSPQVLEEFARLGYDERVILGLGITELLCAVIYLIPSTSVLGAILMTGYLGGAIATHVRVGDPLFNQITPGVLGVLVWLGLYLRDPRLRALLPLRS